MKKFSVRCLMILICLSLLCSCGKPKNLCLRNAAWGMTMEQVKASEDGKIADGPSENVLNWVQTDEIELFGGRTVTVAYLFSEDKLSSITVLCFTEEGETLTDAMNATRAAISAEYGEGSTAENKTAWKNDISTLSLEPLEGSDTSFIVLMHPIANTDK